MKGEFVGGCDIIREMFQAGELQQLFADKGVPALDRRLNLSARLLGDVRLEVVVADITTLRVDAIVNAANSSLCLAAVASMGRSIVPQVLSS